MFVTSDDCASTPILDCMFVGQFVTCCGDETRSREMDEEISKLQRIRLARAQWGSTSCIIYGNGKNFSRSIQTFQLVNLRIKNVVVAQNIE